MSFNYLDLSATLGTGLNTTNRPDPNTLGTKNPYPATFINPLKVSSAWATQGKKALFPLGILDGRGQMPVKLHFIPSDGAAVTYTITMWMYNRLSNTWAKPANNASLSYTGETIDYIIDPGNDPIYLQVSSLSSGTLSIYFDSNIALGL